MLSNKTDHVKHTYTHTHTHTHTHKHEMENINVLDWTEQILNFWQIHLFQTTYNATNKQKIKHTD